MKHTLGDLKQMQSLPLSVKLIMTKQRIRAWINEYGEEGVYVSFSGGKDSTVLLHIVRSIYPCVEAVFVDTGLEYPEIRQFVKTFDNVTILRPKMRFDQVIKKYGYPIVSKDVASTVSQGKANIKSGKLNTLRLKQLRGELIKNDGSPSMFNKQKWQPLLNVDFNVSDRCCSVMKKSPIHSYDVQSGKKAIVAVMATESKQRFASWVKNGCNAFNIKYPQSRPLSFWTEQDILQYIKENNLPIASVYGSIQYEVDPYQTRLEDFGVKGCGKDKLCTTGGDRTGCIFCGFGCHLEKGESRFERLKKTHPRQYDYCLNGGEYDENGIWKPNKDGLGMKHIFDELNKIYGDGFIRY